MAHGFLTPTPVTGESPIIGYLERKIGKQLEKIADHLQGIRRNTAKSRDTTYRSGRGATEVAGRFGIGENTAVGGGFLPGRKAPKMLQGSSGSIEKNPINVDLKTGAKVATPGGPKRLPGGASASTTPGITSTGGLKDSRFFSKSGELNIEKLRASGKSAEEQKTIVRDYRASLRAKGVAPTGEGAPPITPDSGADIVAAVNRNTEAIVALSALTKDQTSKQVSMHNEQEARADRRTSRERARAEERRLEQGGDFSDFLTPTNFKGRRLLPGAGGTGGGRRDMGDFFKTLVRRGVSPSKAGAQAIAKGARFGAVKLAQMGAKKPLAAMNAAKMMPKVAENASKLLFGTAKSAPIVKTALGSGKVVAKTSAKSLASAATAGEMAAKGARSKVATRAAADVGEYFIEGGVRQASKAAPSKILARLVDEGVPKKEAVRIVADQFGSDAANQLVKAGAKKGTGAAKVAAGLAKPGAKALGKSVLKKIPVIAGLAGIVFGVQRALEGDYLGAGLEIASGVMGATGVGAGASLGIDGFLLARDLGMTPFAKGGIITEPTNALMGEAGAEGVFPLEGAKGRRTFAMFGDAFIDAQKKRKKEVAQIQLEGYKLFAKEQEYMKVFDLFNPARWFNGNNGNTQNRRGSGVSGRSPMVGPPPPVSGGRTSGTPLNSTGAKGVLDVIASVESNGSYDVFNTARGGTPGKATEKTIGWLAKNAQGAIGRYQHMPEFILERAARFGYDANTRFTPEVQDDITIKMMQEQHGLDDFLSGDMSAATFAAKLAPTWRGLPQGQKAANRLGGTADSTYMDQYSSGNKAHMSWADSVSNFERIQSGYDPKKKVTGLTPSAEDMNWYNNMQSSNPNTGTPLMATSAQVASASTSASPTVINNYYTGGNGSGQQQVNPNGVSAAPGMSATGTEVFQELKIRALA
jgi:hypothetical protein